LSKSDIYGVTLSGNGKVVFAGGVPDRTLWDASNGRVLHSFHVSSGYGSVALSSDGKRAITTHYDTIASIWDTDTGKVVRSFSNRDFEIKQSMPTVALSRDGKFALTSAFDLTADLWDTATGNKVQRFPGRSEAAAQKPVQLLVDGHAPIHSLGLSEDGQTLLAGYAWGAAVWDLGQAKRLHVLRHQGNVEAAALSGDGKLVLTCADRKATLWDAATGNKLRDLAGHTDSVRGVALDAKGTRALTASQDQTAILWDTATGKKIQTFKSGDILLRVALHDDVTVLTGSLRGQAALWGINSGRALKGFGHKEAITGLAEGFDKRIPFVISAGGKSAVMWSKIDGKVIRTFKHEGDVKCLCLSADLKHLATGSDWGIANLWKIDTGKPISGKPIQTFVHGQRGPGDNVTGVALSPNGKHLWTSTGGGSVRLWDVKNGQELCRLYSGAGDSAHWLVTTPDGHFDGSPDAWKHVTYRVAGTAAVFDDDATRRTFHRPGLLARILEGKN
jgi:WD40 repeat protein